MSRIIVFILFVFLVCTHGKTQEITILDGLTQHRMEGVKIKAMDGSVNALTNAEGRFLLDSFLHIDSVSISYPGYVVQYWRTSDLSKNLTVELEDEPIAIVETVITASRWKQDRHEIPGKITKLNLKNVDILAPQTTADLLDNSGSVFVQKSQLAGGSPQLRGFGTNRVMIVVDGVRMNNAIFRSGNLQNVISLDANSLSNVDVLFGPSAVLYGSDAIGGVMSFKTLTGNYSYTDTLKTKTNIFSRYSSSSNELTGHVDVNIYKKKWSILTSATYARYEDLVAGKYGNDSYLRPTYQDRINDRDTTLMNQSPRIQIGSGFSQLNLIQKIQYRPSKKNEFIYTGIYSTTSNAPRYDRLIQDKNMDLVLDFGEWYYGPQTWMSHTLNWIHSPKENTLYDELSVVIGYQVFGESRHDRKVGEQQRRNQFEKVHAFSMNFDLTKKLSSRSKLFYGAEGVFNAVLSEANKENIYTGSRIAINPRYPNNSTWQTYGVYTKLKFDLTEEWIFTTGLRFSAYHVKTIFDQDLFSYTDAENINANFALNGSMGILFHPDKSSKYYLNISSGFRAPNVDDIGKVFDSEPGAVVVPNVDLQPEYAYNVELGFEKFFGSKVKLDLAVYGTYLKDAMSRANFQLNGLDSILYQGVISNVEAIQNSSNAYVYGMQFGVEWVIYKGFSLKSTINYQKGEQYEVNLGAYRPKPHIAPLFGRASLQYKRRRFRIVTSFIFNGRIGASELPLIERNAVGYAQRNGENYVPEWYTLNVNASYFFNKHLSVNAGVQNITNQLYRTVGSGISASGRNYIVSFKASF